jgi:hypothetical protein
METETVRTNELVGNESRDADSGRHKGHNSEGNRRPVPPR